MAHPNDNPPPSSNESLSGEARAGIVEQAAAAIGDAQLPLEEVFRALAEDADGRRWRRVCSRLADEVARGADLAAAADTAAAGLPAPLRRGLTEATRSGHAPAVLQAWANHDAARRQTRRRLRSALLYPAIVSAILAAVVTGLSLIVVPQFQEMFEEFGFELGVVTQVVIDASHILPWVAAAIMAAALACFIASLLPGGRRLIHWLRTATPILGRLWIISAQHEFASLLGAMTAERMALVDALRFTADSLTDLNVARATRILAVKCDQGAPLSRGLIESLHFDRALSGLAAWGEANDALADALGQAKSLFEQELELQATFLRRILPPLLFVVVLTTIFVAVMALIVPLVDVLNNLSG
jgi:general secretion pathway protein F